MDTFSPETLIPLLSQNALLLLVAVAGLLFYGYVADQVVFEGRGAVQVGSFAGADLVTALFLVLLFLLLILLQIGSPATQRETLAAPSTREMLSGITFNEAIFLALVAAPLVSLKYRGIRLRELFGLGRVGAVGVGGSAVLLLLAAFPLIVLTLEFSRVLLAGLGRGTEMPQEMVRFLAENHSVPARTAVAVSALVLAPMQEELIFRGYLYGVARKYCGPFAGLVLVSLLFAAIHMHAPSFGGLFVLAVCLTLAYEWTGSILVPMMMHALFNSITVINILKGGSAD